MSWIPESVLEDRVVRLEPLRIAHVEALQTAVADGESWKLWYASVPHPDAMRDYVARAVAGAEQGDVAYAVRALADDKIVGTTRFYRVDADNKRAKIGYTWYSASVRRTPVNTACKLLLLSQVFEACQAHAVEFRTHVMNHASRRAIERLGAKQDGILRHHQVLPNGTLRDTVVYSIVASEWPTVRCHLRSKLAVDA
ncbi:MAG TPA: GNAT family N-acetyltransferase [Gammaproteobacteria bacterium]|nr:GNAT family N-acetyltransferase [Gammaproteobacteria bacterium]